MKNITIHDVAEKAGVSVTTVSRVINNRGYISEKTKNLVNAVIDELDYIPNEIARSFYTNKTKLIGLIVPTISNPFFGELSFYIERYLAKEGYKVFICNSINDIGNEKKYLRMLQENRVDGIIVGSHNMDIKEYEKFETKIVSIERELTKSIPMIQSDDYQGGWMATEELINKGCKNILCVSGNLSVKTPANDRAKAYSDCIKKYGYGEKLIEIPFTLSNDEKTTILKEALVKPIKYDGIFATDDMMAMRVYNLLVSMNYNIPTDIKIVGFDGTETIRELIPTLTTIVQPIEDLAKNAVNLLLKRIEGKETENKVVLPVTLRRGKTT